MSDKSADVLLVSADDALRQAVEKHCPQLRTLECVAPNQWSALGGARQQWVDLDTLGAAALVEPGAAQRVYFYSEPPARERMLPPGVFVRKPCTDSTIEILWSRVVETAAGAGLPAWVADYHVLGANELYRRCVETLPGRLGYRDISIYVHDAALGLLTLAETNVRRPIDLAVRLDGHQDHLMVDVAGSREMLWADDLEHEPRSRRVTRPKFGNPPSDARCLIAPLCVGEELVGVINLSRRPTQNAGEPWTRPQLDALFAFLARCVSHARQFERARTEARVDALTGLFNFRWSAETLAQETQRSARFGSPLSLISIDLDGLKGLNDKHGHAVGDAVLRHVAGKISRALRRIDAAARVGGDEFLVILPGTDLAGARLVARRIRNAIRDDRPFVGADALSVTVSLGVAAWSAGMKADDIRAAADEALYTAKNGGRDRVVCRGQETTVANAGLAASPTARANQPRA
ncbi:MAG: sensor domain-containing diguanylate cyclase [Phycisphaerae bacterium]